MIWERLVSKTVRNYWKKVGFEPSEALKAAIVYNSPLKEDEVSEAYMAMYFMSRFDVRIPYYEWYHT